MPFIYTNNSVLGTCTLSAPSVPRSTRLDWQAICVQPCADAPLFRNVFSLTHTCQGRVQYSRIRSADNNTSDGIAEVCLLKTESHWVRRQSRSKTRRVRILSNTARLRRFLILFTAASVSVKRLNQAPIETRSIPLSLPRARAAPGDHCQMPIDRATGSTAIALVLRTKLYIRTYDALIRVTR